MDSLFSLDQRNRMLKREITYKDPFEGNSYTETFYFHLNRVELIDFQVRHKEGLEEYVKGIINTEDNKEAFDEMKELVLMAHGIRGEDDRVFQKSEDIKNRFRSHAAFDQLVFELLSNQTAIEEFIKGIIPEDQLNELRTMAAVPTPPIPAPPTPQT